MRRAWNQVAELVAAHPLAAAIVAGALARIVCALVGVGFHARDDYFHVLDPALRWAEAPGFDWDATDLPGAGIRSHLVPRAVWLLVLGARAVGITEPTSLLRLVYLTVGAYSLLVIPAAYAATRRLADEKSATLAAWLCALHFAMPYAGTRLLIEAMAMPPLVAGLWLVTYDSLRTRFVAGLFVGLACWFRFQVSVAAVALGVTLALVVALTRGRRAAATSLGAFAGGGIAAVGLQGLFDLWTTGTFLGPLWRNVVQNLDPPAGLSRSSPFVYLGLWLLLTVPPATVVLAPFLARVSMRLVLVTWPFLAFVLFHSLVPHKEDRFMLPALPLFLILLAAVPSEVAATARHWPALSAWWPRTRTSLIVVHALALAIAVTSQSQANLRQAMQTLRADPGTRAIVSLGPELQLFFLGRPEVPSTRRGNLDVGWLEREVGALTSRGTAPNRFLAFAGEAGRVEIALAAVGLVCESPEVVPGYWLDRALARLNPQRNKRRAPIYLWRCERRENALAPGRAAPALLPAG
jgi:hypothetical protein